MDERETYRQLVSPRNAFHRQIGVEHQHSPVAWLGRPAQVEKQFGEEPRVEAVIGLELDFDEGIGVVAGVRRDEQAVEPEGGLLEFLGAEFVGVGAAGIKAGKLQSDAGPVAEEFVKRLSVFTGDRRPRRPGRRA